MKFQYSLAFYESFNVSNKNIIAPKNVCEKCYKTRIKAIYKTYIGDFCEFCISKLEETDPDFSIGLGGLEKNNEI